MTRSLCICRAWARSAELRHRGHVVVCGGDSDARNSRSRTARAGRPHAYSVSTYFLASSALFAPRWRERAPDRHQRGNRHQRAAQRQ